MEVSCGFISSTIQGAINEDCADPLSEKRIRERESALGVHWSIWPGVILLASASARMEDRHTCTSTITKYIYERTKISLTVMNKVDISGQNDGTQLNTLVQCDRGRKGVAVDIKD